MEIIIKERQAAVALSFSWQSVGLPGKQPEEKKPGKDSKAAAGRKQCLLKVWHLTLQLLDK